VGGRETGRQKKSNQNSIIISFHRPQMLSSNISDPFVLASYTSSFRGKVQQRNTPGVYASSYKRPNKTNEFVTVAVQADGVHVLDVRFILCL